MIVAMSYCIHHPWAKMVEGSDAFIADRAVMSAGWLNTVADTTKSKENSLFYIQAILFPLLSLFIPRSCRKLVQNSPLFLGYCTRVRGNTSHEVEQNTRHYIHSHGCMKKKPKIVIIFTEKGHHTIKVHATNRNYEHSCASCHNRCQNASDEEFPPNSDVIT